MVVVGFSIRFGLSMNDLDGLIIASINNAVEIERNRRRICVLAIVVSWLVFPSNHVFLLPFCGRY